MEQKMANKKKKITTVLIVLAVIVVLGFLIYLGKTIWFKADSVTPVVTNKATLIDANGQTIDSYDLDINTP